MTPHEAKRHAAVCFALACTRGLLYDFAFDGTPNLVEARAALEATSAANLAGVIGSTEEEVFPDWNEHLSGEEKDLISGHTKRV